MLTKEEQVKVMVFGLAQLAARLKRRWPIPS